MSQKTDETHAKIRNTYGKIAENGKYVSDAFKNNSNGCGCSSSHNNTLNISRLSNASDIEITKIIGYSKEDIEILPDGADLGLGCGNPAALASIKEGEIVLDLGSGAGIDVFIASKKVGPKGKAIGVDMTPQMIERARSNARKGNFSNVEFRLGEIENIPVADSYVDLIISNCVINLVPDKSRVYQEALRVLKPNGRMVFSDIVLEGYFPDFILKLIEQTGNCISRENTKEIYLKKLKNAGFSKIEVKSERNLTGIIWDGLGEFEKNMLWSALVNSENINKSPKNRDETLIDFIENRLGKILSIEIIALK